MSDIADADIKITPFCHEDYKSLTIDDKLYVLCAKNPVNALQEVYINKGPVNHNAYLPSLDSETMEIHNGNKLCTVNTDAALYLLVEIRLNDLNTMVKELDKYFNKKFRTEIRTYLDGGCNEEPIIRKKKCKSSEILKDGVTRNTLKKIFEKNST